jgi:hypothetical protein
VKDIAGACTSQRVVFCGKDLFGLGWWRRKDSMKNGGGEGKVKERGNWEEGKKAERQGKARRVLPFLKVAAGEKAILHSDCRVKETTKNEGTEKKDGVGKK